MRKTSSYMLSQRNPRHVCVARFVSDSWVSCSLMERVSQTKRHCCQASLIGVDSRSQYFNSLTPTVWVYSYKASTLTLRPERQSARVSKTTNDCFVLTLSGTGFIAVGAYRYGNSGRQRIKSIAETVVVEVLWAVDKWPARWCLLSVHFTLQTYRIGYCGEISGKVSSIKSTDNVWLTTRFLVL